MISPHDEQWLRNQNSFSKDIFLPNVGSYPLQNMRAGISYEKRYSAPSSVYGSRVGLGASDAHGTCVPPEPRPDTGTREVPATGKGGSYTPLVPNRKTGTITCFIHLENVPITKIILDFHRSFTVKPHHSKPLQCGPHLGISFLLSMNKVGIY